MNTELTTIAAMLACFAVFEAALVVICFMAALHWFNVAKIQGALLGLLRQQAALQELLETLNRPEARNKSSVKALGTGQYAFQ